MEFKLWMLECELLYSEKGALREADSKRASAEVTLILYGTSELNEWRWLLTFVPGTLIMFYSTALLTS